jgi:hypothetical protein
MGLSRVDQAELSAGYITFAAARKDISKETKECSCQSFYDANMIHSQLCSAKNVQTSFFEGVKTFTGYPKVS